MVARVASSLVALTTPVGPCPTRPTPSYATVSECTKIDLETHEIFQGPEHAPIPPYITVSSIQLSNITVHCILSPPTKKHLPTPLWVCSLPRRQPVYIYIFKEESDMPEYVCSLSTAAVDRECGGGLMYHAPLIVVALMWSVQSEQ